VFVPGSRRYSDPAAYLLTPSKWADQRVEFCRLVGKATDADTALAQLNDELRTALGELEQTLGEGDGPVRLDDDGDLVISPLSAEDVPSEAVALKAELTEMLPFAPVVSLLIELDKRTGYLDCFTHAGGKQARSSELKRNLIAVLLAHATNLGLTRMADACGISYDVLSWTAEWYVREETLRAANLAIIDNRGTPPLTPVFGTGTLSSSDGQRFPTRGKSVTARALSRYFAHEGLSTYTHVTDQHTTYGTKIIVATRREAHYVLDEILGNATDIPITEHATDTHGVTLVNFGLFDLLGLQLSPRIRDLGKITLCRTGSKPEAEAAFPLAGPLLTRRANLDLIAGHYDDLLRVAGSLKFGHATASLLVGKLSASGRQNALAAALKEYGALRRTIYAARYLSDPAYRRKIFRQLNKGESLHALKRDLLYAHEGAVRARHLEAQTEQAWCLTLVTNAVVAWTTEYYGLAVDAIRAAGRRVDDEVLAHISPAHSENITGKGGDIATNRRDEQELSVLCLRILQAALVYVNTLMVQDVLADDDWAQQLTGADRRGLTPLFWTHVAPTAKCRIRDRGAGAQDRPRGRRCRWAAPPSAVPPCLTGPPTPCRWRPSGRRCRRSPRSGGSPPRSPSARCCTPACHPC